MSIPHRIFTESHGICNTTISHCPSALYHCLKRIISCRDSASHIHLAIFLHVSLVPSLFYSRILKACDFISFHLDKILMLDTVEDVPHLYQCGSNPTGHAQAPYNRTRLHLWSLSPSSLEWWGQNTKAGWNSGWSYKEYIKCPPQLTVVVTWGRKAFELKAMKIGRLLLHHNSPLWLTWISIYLKTL